MKSLKSLSVTALLWGLSVFPQDSYSSSKVDCTVDELIEKTRELAVTIAPLQVARVPPRLRETWLRERMAAVNDPFSVRKLIANPLLQHVIGHYRGSRLDPSDTMPWAFDQPLETELDARHVRPLFYPLSESPATREAQILESLEPGEWITLVGTQGQSLTGRLEHKHVAHTAAAGDQESDTIPTREWSIRLFLRIGSQLIVLVNWTQVQSVVRLSEPRANPILSTESEIVASPLSLHTGTILASADDAHTRISVLNGIPQIATRLNPFPLPLSIAPGDPFAASFEARVAVSSTAQRLVLSDFSVHPTNHRAFSWNTITGDDRFRAHSLAISPLLRRTAALGSQSPDRVDVLVFSHVDPDDSRAWSSFHLAGESIQPGALSELFWHERTLVYLRHKLTSVGHTQLILTQWSFAADGPAQRDFVVSELFDWPIAVEYVSTLEIAGISPDGSLITIREHNGPRLGVLRLDRIAPPVVWSRSDPTLLTVARNPGHLDRFTDLLFVESQIPTQRHRRVALIALEQSRELGSVAIEESTDLTRHLAVSQATGLVALYQSSRRSIQFLSDYGETPAMSLSIPEPWEILQVGPFLDQGRRLAVTLRSSPRPEVVSAIIPVAVNRW